MSETAKDEDIFETAATYFEEVRRAGDVESSELTAWLNASPLHRQVYEQMVTNWQLFDDHGADPEVLRMREEGLADARRSGARRWKNGGGSTRRAIAAGIVAAFVTPAAATAWWYFQGKGRSEYKTGTGEQRSIVLADQSHVFLDANTQLRVSLQTTERNVEVVTGRAHFQVAKDRSRPFRVRVADETVTAVGTAFSVERRRGTTNVLLSEGIVTVESPTSPVQWMKPGDELVVGSDKGRTIVAGVDIAKASAWQSGKLYFENETLAAAADRMNDYSKVKLNIQGADIRNLRVSGTFVAGDVAPFVDAIQAVYPLNVRMGDAEVTLSKKS